MSNPQGEQMTPEERDRKDDAVYLAALLHLAGTLAFTIAALMWWGAGAGAFVFGIMCVLALAALRAHIGTKDEADKKD